MPRRATALYSLTGTLSSPKLIEPLQIALAIGVHLPDSSSRSRGPQAAAGDARGILRPPRWRSSAGAVRAERGQPDPRRAPRPRLGQRRDPGRGDRDRRALGRRQVDAAAAAQPARRPDAGTISYRGRPLDEYDPLALRREVSLVPQLPALLEGTVRVEPAPTRPDLAGKELDAERCLRLRRSRPGLRRARRRQALGRRAAAGDAGARARPGAGRPAARRADLGPRPRRPRRDRGDARRAAPRARDLDRPGQPRPRAGAAAGRLGGAARGRPNDRGRPGRGGDWL